MAAKHNRSWNPVPYLGFGTLIVLFFFVLDPLGIYDPDSGDDDNNSYVSQSGSSDNGPEPYSQGIVEAEMDFTVEEFISYAEDLEGAAYLSGGKNPDEGFNSSGFVQHVYEEVTGIRMPRIAGHQQEIGEEVGRGYLQEGDVLFFEANTIMSGIYIGNNEFMTATESNGVSILNLDEDDFWAENYTEARRLTDSEIASLHPGTYKDHEHPAVEGAMHYLGTPYEYGGSTLDAFDCSFFIQEVFREHLDVYLPRVTLDQIHVGEDIAEEDLRPGDVIYFSDVDTEDSDREDEDVTHAGIYVGNNFMIHASRTEDMTQISYLNDYWKDAFTGFKRFDGMSLNNEEPVVQEAGRHLTAPFQSGGSHPDEGFNTTGFVRYVYESAKGIHLPANARAIREEGTEVEKSSLLPGDILFFEGTNSFLPAIYIGHDQFIVASESSGVTTRHLYNSEFFADRFESARRY